MAHTPPIDRASLSKAGVFDQNAFFEKLSAYNNYTDIENVKNFHGYENVADKIIEFLSGKIENENPSKNK